MEKIQIGLIISCLLIASFFIASELKGKMLLATILKGIASMMFVILGFINYNKVTSSFGKLVMIGLLLGMIGDILLNMRNLFEGKTSNKVFAVGILAFLSGHFLYIAALINESKNIIFFSIIICAILSIIFIPPLINRVNAPSKGLKIFGYVYLVVVILMFACSLMLIINKGINTKNLLFVLGAFLFVVSDFIMIYYSFGKKLKPLRVTNLTLYYIGQILIACTILFA